MTRECPSCKHVNPSIANFCMICGHKFGTAVIDAKDGVRPFLNIRCAGCRGLIPIFSTVRPLRVQCPSCGKCGVLK